MKKNFLFIFIIFALITYLSQNSTANKIEGFSNDAQCLSAVKRICGSLPKVNTAAVLSKNKSILCGVETDNKENISKDDVYRILRDIFPSAKEIRLEINTKRAEDIMELSYFGASNLNKKYISLRFNFLISED